MKRHVYFGIENLALDDEQRGLLVDALRALGPDHDPQPACLCHWRTRLDGQAAIYEALFEESDITVEAFRNRLGTIFDVDPATIGYSVNYPTFVRLSTAVVTFDHNGTDYLRVAFFGYNGAGWPTWAQSGDECRGYLKAHQEEWDTEA